MHIRVLPSNIANMIAAGEVVQRPASVVKELMENAVDAGADSITVVVTDAGRTLIQVIDNGCGIAPDEAALCFERHATSKIADEADLQNITTFGFRGEALASIAAVAEVTLKTRREEDSVGTVVEFADSHLVSEGEAAAPKGTNIAVRNLFYNVPARRKFLKSDNVELKHIIEEFNRVALTRPEVAFTLIHNGKDINALKKAKSLKFRIQDLLGSNVADPLVELQSDTSVVKISGYVCRPDLARKTPGNQYLFVNGRYFRSPYLHKAIMNAYGEMVAEGAIPSYFIYLETDPHSIDVNIHPTKTEIKFEEDSVVFQVLYAAVREALGSNSFGASIDFSRPAEGMPVFSNRYESFRPDVFAPSVEVDADYNPFNSEGGIPASGDAPAQAPSFRHGQDYSSYVHKTDDYGKLFDDSPVSKERQLIVIQGKYIVSPSATGMMVVSARRAKERILYEKFLKVLSAGGHVSQSALFPVQLRVGAVNVPLLQDNLPLLEKCGFDISILGVDTIVVSGVPDGYSCDPGMVEAMVSDLILILSDGTSSLPGVMESSLAEKFARLGAAEADPVGSQWDAAKLLEALFACENAEFTPSGKKIISEMSVDQMEKLF